MDIARYIDHTLLKQDATSEDIISLCKEAKKYNFYSVCVNPAYVALSSYLLKASSVKVCTVVGFPLGMNTTETKVFETKFAVKYGADEIDVVINVGMAKANDFQYIKEELLAVRKACKKHVLKVILETCLLNEEQIKMICTIAKEIKADFVKTSTGFSKSGATIEDIMLMRQSVGPLMGVKASGGIRTYEDCIKMIEAGANRIGTSSGVTIMEKANSLK